MTSGDQKRRYYRLEFPQFQRPKLFFQHRVFEVIEISEAGARITAAGALPAVGSKIEGTMLFTDGEKETISGKVIRKDGAVLILDLAKGISLQRITTEHRRIHIGSAS